MALWRSPVRSRYGPLPRTIALIVLFHSYPFHKSAQIVFVNMTPTQISAGNSSGLNIIWDDGHAGVSSFRTLRDNCPCAGCQGETVLLKTFKPIPQPELPGKYKLTGAEQVGSYALKLSWADGHATGIYTWQKLRSLCECAECQKSRNSQVPFPS